MCAGLSCQAFNVVFEKAVERAEKNDEVKIRVANLIDTVTFSVFNYTARGLFERDKLIFTTQVCFQVSLLPTHVLCMLLSFIGNVAETYAHPYLLDIRCLR